MNREEFEGIVINTLRGLPKEIRKRIENIEIVIEDYPSPYISQRMGEGLKILGLYQGVPLPRRGPWYGNVLPDRIIIYKKIVEELSPDKESLKETIRRVVLHEIGHYFGLSEDRLRKLGY